MATISKTESTSDVFETLTGKQYFRPQRLAEARTDELPSLLSAALAAPVNYPPLQEALVPGDTIAIALQRDLPQPVHLLHALLDDLLAMNIEPADVTVVLPGSLADEFSIALPTGASAEADDVDSVSSEEQAPPPIFTLQHELHSIACQVHDPENSAGLSYLAANDAAEPVHLNRLLVDADVVIPVGCADGAKPLAFQDCLYPTFGSTAALARYGDAETSTSSLLSESALANDMLGAFFGIQVVAGPLDQIEQVVAGIRDDARAAANAVSAERWQVTTERVHDGVVATIESRAEHQTWEDFSAALINASGVAADGAPIVIWSELSGAVARAVRKACAARFDETISSRLPQKTQQLAGILKEHPVYLRSRVKRSKIEDLNLSVIDSADELQRLTGSFEDCLILRDAHLCRLTAAKGEADVE